MTRFLFCLPRYHTNAVPWVRILSQAGHQVAVHVVLRAPTENYSHIEPEVMEPCAFSKWIMKRWPEREANQPRFFPNPWSYWRVLKAENPDIIIVRGITRWFSRLAAVCAVLQGRRLVVYDQEDAHPKKWSSTWIRRTGLRCLGILHYTARISNNVKEGNSGSALSIPFGCPYKKEEAEAMCKRALNWPPRLLMVAKYRERKGHERLLKALALLAPSMPFSLTFCGEEASDEDSEFCTRLADMAREFDLEDRVKFTNNIANAKMSAVYASRDLFILPSLVEPAAVSPIEACWAGCAVLLSRGSGTRGYFPAGDSFDFDPTSPDDIARSLSEMLASKEALTQARDACVEHINAVAGSVPKY